MLATRPCTATCVIDGMPVILTFYPDNGLLRIADPSGACIRETRWHASWRALLDEFRGYTEGAGIGPQHTDDVLDRLAERTHHATTPAAAIA
jgi:hypothetical protein